MTREKLVEVGSAFFGPLVASVLTLAGTGFFTEKAAPLERRIVALEISDGKQSVQYDEILRRLVEIKEKVEGRN